jgi:hypothetical protein
MELQSEPCVGAWYCGERHTGDFLIVHREPSGFIHLRAADGRRVRMTFERWTRRPLSPAPAGAKGAREPDRFEWNESVIG